MSACPLSRAKGSRAFSDAYFLYVGRLRRRKVPPCSRNSTVNHFGFRGITLVSKNRTIQSWVGDMVRKSFCCGLIKEQKSIFTFRQPHLLPICLVLGLVGRRASGARFSPILIIHQWMYTSSNTLTHKITFIDQKGNFRRDETGFTNIVNNPLC